MLKIPFYKHVSLIDFSNSCDWTVAFIVETHSLSKRVEVCTKIKRSSIAVKSLLRNYAVVYKEKSGCQNCIDWRQT